MFPYLGKVRFCEKLVNPHLVWIESFPTFGAMAAKTRKQMIRGWIMFDWANSAYNLVIVATVFPRIFTHFVKDGSSFMGIHFEKAETLYTYAICFSYLIIAILSPILSGMADYGGYKKRYMQFFSTLGATACIGLYFFDEQNVWIGVLGAVIASIGFSGSLVFYNAFLPQIVPSKFQDKVSAKGFAFGYFGSSLLLILLIVLNTFKTSLGFEEKSVMVFRIGFILVGLWWFGWARWTFSVLPGSEGHKIDRKGIVGKGFAELKQVWAQIRELPRLKRFLSAFFVVDLGVQTIIIIAPLFALNIAKMEGSELILTVLIMQFVGIAGSLVFSKLSDRVGNVIALSSATGVYLVVCIMAIIFSDKLVFYIIAGLMGFAMGGVQSLSRSTYSKLLPKTNDHASFFSFYDVLEKVAVLVGTFIYATVDMVGAELNKGDEESAIAEKLGVATLAVFFIFGLYLLRRLRKFKSLDPHEELAQ